MVTVKISKDIREYQEKVLGGLTLRQLISIIASAFVVIPMYFVLGGKMNVNDIAQNLGFIGIPVMLPIILFGFLQICGMSTEQYIACMVRFFRAKSKRKFVSENEFRRLEREYDTENSAPPLSLKLKNAASYERVFLTEEARANGTEIDTEEIKLMTVKIHKSPKSGKPDDENRNEKKKSKSEIALDRIKTRAESIKAKQAEDSKYIYTAKERALIRRYVKLLEQVRIEEIRNGAKKISVKNEQMKKRRHLPNTQTDTVQRALPYIADYDNGMFEVEENVYNKMYELNDINYSSMRQEEQMDTVAKYSEFLNYFSEDIVVTVSLDNRIISKGEQENRIFYPLTGEDYDNHRKEYNKIMRRQLEAGRNNIILSKYVTVSIKCDTPVEAASKFHKIDNEILTGLDTVGAGGRMLTTDERLSLLHDKFRKGREGELKIDYEFLKTNGISSKDYVAPASMYFTPKYFMIDDEYCCCMFLTNIPATLGDDFFMELADNDFPATVTMNIQPLAQDKALKMVRKKRQGMDANIIEAQKNAVKSGYSPDIINPTLRQSAEEAEEQLENMTRRSQKMFYVTFTIMVTGSSKEELDERVKTVQSKARKQTAQMIKLDFQQETAFRVVVPGGAPPTKLYVDRALTSDATAIFVPYSCQEMFQTGGFYYGINKISRNLILLDRKNLRTPSGFILGSSGSGKSFAAKREMLNVLLRDGRTSLLIIDPENEYGDFIQAFGGVSMAISADTDNYINPMEMTEDYGLDENDVSENISLEKKKEKALQCKSEYIMSIIQCMMENNITPQQKTLVDRCVRKCYKKYLDNDFNSKYLPSLVDLQKFFDEEGKSSAEALKVAQAAEYYTRGSLNVFSHKSNIDLSNRAIAFNIRDLGDRLKQIALLIVLDFIWNRMIENAGQGVQTYCYVDEIHVLFRNDYSARFLQQLYKRGRKYGLVITGITQDIDDLLQSNAARGMINNSDFLLLLNQSNQNVKVLKDLLRLSEVQESFIDDVEIGSGLIRANKVIVPFVDRFPSDSYLYKLMSTNFNERMETEKLKREAERELKNP